MPYVLKVPSPHGACTALSNMARGQPIPPNQIDSKLRANSCASSHPTRDHTPAQVSISYSEASHNPKTPALFAVTPSLLRTCPVRPISSACVQPPQKPLDKSDSLNSRSKTPVQSSNSSIPVIKTPSSKVDVKTPARRSKRTKSIGRSAQRCESAPRSRPKSRITAGRRAHANPKALDSSIVGVQKTNSKVLGIAQESRPKARITAPVRPAHAKALNTAHHKVGVKKTPTEQRACVTLASRSTAELANLKKAFGVFCH